MRTSASKKVIFDYSALLNTIPGMSRNKHGQKGKLGSSSSISPPFGIHTVPTFVPTTTPPPELLQPSHLQSSPNQHALCRDYIHDPVQLADLWSDPLYARNVSWKRDVRCVVQIGTIIAILRSRYMLPDGRRIELDSSRRARERMVKGVVYIASDTEHPEPPKLLFDTKCPAIVRDADCLDATLALVAEGLRPVCLVLASASHPGGGYRTGSGAQEENICRRTNLFEVLEDPYGLDPTRNWSYPVPDFGGIYVPRLLVIRGTEQSGYPFLEQPVEIATLNTYAYKDPPLETPAIEGGKRGSQRKVEPRLPANIVRLYRKKIDAIFRIAVAHNHDAIVLGALGCGAYGTPPRHMAEIFKECLEPYRKCFRKVVFAILDDNNSFKDHNPEGNLVPFQQVFEE